MSKSILVVEGYPGDCIKCRFLRTAGTKNIYECGLTGGVRIANKKDIWCPLRLLPEENKAPKLASGYELGYEEGWNNCLKKIINESVVKIDKTYKIPCDLQEKSYSNVEATIRDYFSRILHQWEESTHD
nr:MAG TPA: hypothetical protein [Caudoviricetes sp.]